MGDVRFHFEDDDGPNPNATAELLSKSMADSQRRLIREAFELLRNAHQQFAVGEELTGVRIGSMGDLQNSTTQPLGLPRKPRQECQETKHR